MKKVIFVLIVLALIGGAWFWASLKGHSQYEQASTAALAALEQTSQAQPGRYSAKDFEGLPPVMRAYLEKAMPKEGPRATRLQLELTGEIKMAEDSSWAQYKAVQGLNGQNPGLVWAAEVDWFFLSPVTIMISLTDEKAEIRTDLWGMVNMFANSGSGFKQYLMLRWLAEAVWHPDAFLPGPNLTWAEENNPKLSVKGARATLEWEGDKVSGVFYFTKVGSAPMMFLSDPEATGPFAGQRWYCQYSDWSRQGQLQIPKSLVQGARRGLTDDLRLRQKVKKLVLK